MNDAENVESSGAPARDAEPHSEAVPREKGHPAGLYILFATEMWERFCYYGMRALLLLYLVEYLGWQPQPANEVYKWYTSLVYLSPLLGGFISDRFLGLRVSITLGAALMAVGEFCLTANKLPLFYAGLALLIIGNGFFKPNISTLVGKMYRKGDARRDSAFTIFYMGVNLGAFLSPIVCGYLREHYGFAYGFGAAGVGMILAGVIFVVGQPIVRKAVEAAGNDMSNVPSKTAGTKGEVVREADEGVPGESGFVGTLSNAWPYVMMVGGLVIQIVKGISYAHGETKLAAFFMWFAFGAIAEWMGYTLTRIRGAAKDKSNVIFMTFLFVVLFWMGFEQAGNSLNLWAAFHTNRDIGPVHLTAESFQSVNSIWILAMAPVLAWLWPWLARRGREPSAPGKMVYTLVFMTAAYLTMVAAANFEQRVESRVPLASVPAGVKVDELNAGRVQYDAEKHELVAHGSVATFVVNDALSRTAAPDYKAAIEDLAARAEKATPSAPVSVKLPSLPAGYELPTEAKDGVKVKAAYDPEAQTLTVREPIDAPAKTALVNAGAPAEWRNAVFELRDRSRAAGVSSFWLILFYFLATIAELCISPVGLSLVTKLAPARYGSLFMGVFLMANSVAQYVGGGIGESWGQVAPVDYFMLFVWTSAIGAAVLLVLYKPFERLMHNVR